ncbi:uncharacterized protein LOC102800566 [Saccoglossus kowalevskii]|uniref:Uncharacterized protein LOC102800566 n=1 Tax=Saccoglossus kowalevskii TaxID=10224 RepID=A0ABM0LW89_SACKO|nr:PREDICTED: uncharacterized protein LOC102800566 [Saccoglossus kowalevskii]
MIKHVSTIYKQSKKQCSTKDDMDLYDTKLHEAVRYGDTNLVLKCLKDGDNPNDIGLYQWSGLHEAANNGDLEILQMLLDYKGDPNAQDELHGCTAVHYAAQEGYVDCLTALIDAGGQYDVKNDDGLNCLDVAVGKCKQILDKQRVRKLMRLSPKDARKEIIQETENYNRSRVIQGKEETNTKIEHQTSKKAWEEIEVISSMVLPAPKIEDRNDETVSEKSEEINKEADLTDEVRSEHRLACLDSINPEIVQDILEPNAGVLLLSFEYNSKTQIFKIRVWQLEDILLPPVEASMISRIYVKSYLLPDKKRETKRRTEEVKVEEAERSKQTIVTVKKKRKDSHKAIFQPSKFKFTRPLDYKKINKDVIESRTIHLSVCVKQKFSNRSFTIANCQISMSAAVKKLKREKFKLTSCINPTIPSNLHLYSSDLIIVNQGLYSNITASDPNLRKKSLQSLAVDEDDAQRASSEGNLREVRCHSAESIPSIVIEMPKDERLIPEFEGVSVIADERKDKKHPELTVIDVPGLYVSDDELEKITIQSNHENMLFSTDVCNVAEKCPELVPSDDDLDEEEVMGSRRGRVSPKPGYVVGVRNQVVQVQVHSGTSSGSSNTNDAATADNNVSPHSVEFKSNGTPSMLIHHINESSPKKTPPMRKTRTDQTAIANTKTGLQFSGTNTPELVAYKTISPYGKKIKDYPTSQEFSQSDSTSYSLNHPGTCMKQNPTQKKNFTKLSYVSPNDQNDSVHSHETQNTQLPDMEKKAGCQILNLPENDEILDPNLKDKLTTPEFKLQMFQRTANEPHPALPGYPVRVDTMDESDPFFVPRTPLKSPAISQSLPKELTNADDDSTNENTLESPTITKLKQSWI